jgi:glutathionylspermidine synthase
MKRHLITPRPDWQATVAKTGLTYNTLADGSPYWDESAYWEFTSAEVDQIEAATAEIQSLALAAGDHILDRNRLAEMHIPPEAHARIREAWNAEPPALYGRLDLAYDSRQIKLLEYNADTPTALVEAAVTQWYWLQDVFPNADQFNSIHEKLVAKWKDLHGYVHQPVYFGHDGSEEDFMTVSYLRDTAEQSGLKTHPIAMHEIGWEEAKSRFVDLDRRPIETIFKLYPWEWMLNERFAPQTLATMSHTQKDPVQWLEPIWKMLWSNKALLAILWELNPNHELLLPAYLDGPRNLKDYVKKPLFGREGKGVKVFRNWVEDTSIDPYAGQDSAAESEVCVHQKLAALAEADGNTAVIGSWLIDGEPAGMGIRESKSLVTTNTSRFAPHLFR